jgi:hypothetical protein
VIGGGTCSNGGWVPASSVRCSGLPDPFVAIGGGVCINGGWIPRNTPAPAPAPQPAPEPLSLTPVAVEAAARPVAMLVRRM